MKSVRIAAHRHYLGAWNAAENIRVRGDDGAWRVATVAELADRTGDDATVRVFTLPRWIRGDLEALPWSDGTDGAVAPEREAFADYVQRVVAFCQFIGLPLHNVSADLVAGPRRELREVVASLAVLANVADAPLRVELGNSAVILGPSHGCVIALDAVEWAVALEGDAEYGLHLELIETPPRA